MPHSILIDLQLDLATATRGLWKEKEKEESKD